MKSLTEIRDSFNLKYSNVNSGDAPGLNDYEISMYLTEAQKQVLDEYYRGTPGRGESFELTERARKALSGLVETMEVLLDASGSTASIPGVSPKFSCVEAFGDSLVARSRWRVLVESVLLRVEDDEGNEIAGDCDNGKVLEVEVASLDTLVVALKNPFRRPDDDHVFRVDTRAGETLVFSAGLLKSRPGRKVKAIYSNAFLRFPSPLILVDLNDFVIANGLGTYDLTIDGMTSPSTLPLPYDDFVLDMIISRAVVLATKDYKENTLGTQATLQVAAE
jgi:hypothetical protein